MPTVFLFEKPKGTQADSKGQRSMKPTKLRNPDKPDLQFTLQYPTETDKLRLRSGALVPREISDRERRRLEHERK